MAAKFKSSYDYTMGGSQTLVFPNGQEFTFNDKEYYSGRGAKYNSAIKHDEKGVINIPKKAVAAFLKSEKEKAQVIKKYLAEKKAAEKLYNENKMAGIYGITENNESFHINLSAEEAEGRFFDAERLAATLNISVNDAYLLNSRGKTYVFAKENNSDRILELYHANLSCNRLSIWVSYPTADRLKEFNHEEWASAPYADQVGMTENKNHFVC